MYLGGNRRWVPLVFAATATRTKKPVALDWQNNNSAHASRFDVHFLADYDVTLPNFTFFEGRELELLNFLPVFRTLQIHSFRF